MNELSLFTGAGGGLLGTKLLGWKCVCAVEFEPYCQRILIERQNDRTFEPFPVWDDVRTFDGTAWRGCVDVVSGGFPCQDISAAGSGAGINGRRSWLWSEMARIIDEVRPRFVFVENSPMLLSRGLDRVVSDLSAMGYDSRWGIVGAHHAGAPHKRDRIWLLGYSDGLTGSAGSNPQSAVDEEANSEGGADQSRRSSSSSVPLANSNRNRESQPQGTLGKVGRRIGDGSCEARDIPHSAPERRCLNAIQPNTFDGEAGEGGESPLGRAYFESSRPWVVEPRLGRVANGVANRSHRLRAIGNGQVPAVVATAWRILSEGIY